MTDVKQLPENLEQLEQLTEFKRVYKKNTVEQLEDLLTEAEVDYLSADNKSELVWRLLDHRDFDFEAAIALESTPTEESADEQPVPDDEPVEPTVEPAPADEQVDESVVADDKVDTNEDVQTIQDDTSDGDSAQVDGEANANTGTDSASTDDSEKPNEVVDTTDNDAPSDIGNIDDASANEIEQSAKAPDQPTTDSSASDNKAFIEAPVSEAEFVEVKNKGSFNMLEPATSTLVKAGKTTKIYIKGYATKDQVLRNIAQYNQTRGDKLTVTN
ncbi:hypothetical protein [Psychrobacter aquimaris]|uniref:hypothetical protein n=1 Tax=Psychrobacter aquimaris TaxID=292733 RepID=UPI0018DF2E90|nr:hypothetical protein [Psychrobacter aquimaris]